VRRVIAPRGAALGDGEIICRLAEALGHRDRFPTASAQAVWDEIRGLWPAVRGITYGRIDAHGLQWPCLDERDPGTRVLHAQTFSHGPRAQLQCVDFLPTPECTDDDYPFLLTTGRTLHQFNVGTMTGRSPQRLLRETDTLDMHPSDASLLGLRDGATVRVASRHGAALLPLRITEAVMPGQLFATFHDPARGLNAVTGPVRDSMTGAPEYKVVAVQVAPANDLPLGR
jgi:formate dehydrogenase major subunit